MTVLRAPILAVAAIALSAARAGAALDWIGAHRLSSAGTSVTEAHVAGGPGDVAAAVWREIDQVQAASVWAAARVAGAWTTPTRLSTSPGEFVPPNLGVAVDPSGTAVVVWLEAAGDGERIVRAATRDRDGTWSSPQDLSPPGMAPVFPRVALDGAGTATAVWRARPALGAPDVTPLLAQRRLRGESWSAPAPITADSPKDMAVYTGLEVAADLAGSVTVSAVRNSRDGSNVFAIETPADGDWRGPQRLLADPQTVGLDTWLAKTPVGGFPTVAWRQHLPGVGDTAMAATRSTPGVEFGIAGALPLRPATIDDLGAGAVGLTPADGMTVTALLRDEFSTLWWTARGTQTGWQTPQHLDDENVSEARLGTTANGSVLAVWRRRKPAGVYFAAQAGPGAAFGAITTVPGPRSDAHLLDLAIDGSGVPALLWRQDEANESDVLFGNGRGGPPPTIPELACGNGVAEEGEQCDAGRANGTAGACCSTACTATAGAACDDGDGCRGDDTCDATGACRSGDQCPGVQFQGTATPAPARQALRVAVGLANTEGSGRASVDATGYAAGGSPSAAAARAQAPAAQLTRTVRRLLAAKKQYRATVRLKLNREGKRRLKAAPRGGFLDVLLVVNVTDRRGVVTTVAQPVQVKR